MIINVKLDTHGYNIGDIIEFRPHNARRKTVIGEILYFGYHERYCVDIDETGSANEHAVMYAKIIDSPDKEDIGTVKKTASWLEHKYCHKVEK